MQTFKARDLAHMPMADIWRLPDMRFLLEFDDGVIEAYTRETVVSAYFWRIHQVYPDTPLLMKHHMNGRAYAAESHKQLLGMAFWAYYDAYRYTPGFDMEPALKLCYEIFNQFYNDMTRENDRYVTGISILDFIDVLDHPEVDAANIHIQTVPVANNREIDLARATVLNIVRTSPLFANNAIANAVRNNLVNKDQIGQVLCAVGFRTDADSFAFREPVRTSFTQGLTTLADSMKESRSATKASDYAKNSVSDSEYTNRNVQLSSSCLQNLHLGDCGSMTYIPFTVDTEKHLKDLDGIYRYIAEEDRLQMITPEQKDLIGHTIAIRSVFGCRHPDRNGVCVVCYGEIGLSIPANTNLGHVSATELNAKSGQALLSTKHSDGNTAVEEVVLAPECDGFVIMQHGVTIGIDPKLAGRKYTVTITSEDGEGLQDVRYVDDVRYLSAGRLTKITGMQFSVANVHGEPTVFTIPLGTASRRPFFSHAMLTYVQRVGWQMDDYGQYVIDMTDWPVDDVFMELPLKQFSMPEYAKAIDTFIKSTKETTLPKLTNYDNPAAALMAFHDLVSMKLDVNISHLQAIILAASVESVHGRDFGLPRNRMQGEAVPYKRLLFMRSISALMAYEGQAAGLYGAESYIVTNRPDHVLDDLIMG